MEGVDAEPFMEGIQRTAMVPFAIRPVTLVMLIQDLEVKVDFQKIAPNYMTTIVYTCAAN